MASATGQQQIYYARPVKVIDPTQSQLMTGKCQSLCKESNEKPLLTGNSNYDTQDKRKPSGSAPILPPRIKLSMPSVKLQREKFSAGIGNVMTRRTRDTTPLSVQKVGNSKVASAVSSLNSKSSPKLASERLANSKASERSGGVTPPPKLPPRIRNFRQEAGTGHSTTHNSSNASITPEPQPLTRTNVTKHDVIWNKDEPESEKCNGELCPPLKHITPETTEELWEKYNPIDNLDSASDHSDSSADTMIMMTTDEEKRNEEKILHSKIQYESKKGQRVIGIESDEFESNGQVSGEKSEQKHQQQSLEDENFTDDGYGTNSSTSTTLSSSLSSLPTSDLDNSTNQGTVKKSVNFSDHNVIIPNTSVQPGTWAVKRRTKMAERHDAGSSLQEKLRQLAIIEEEDNTQYNDNHESKRLSTGNYSKMNGYQLSNARLCDHKKDTEPGQGHNQDQGNGHMTEATERDLRRFEGDLFDKLMDMDRNYRNYSGFEDEYSPVKEDSKVLYFQQKVLKQKYNSSDNYYNPRLYYTGVPSNEPLIENRVPDPGTFTTQPNLADMSKNMATVPKPDQSHATGGHHWQHANGPIAPTYTGQTLSYRSVSSGHGSMDESYDQNICNMSCDNIFYHGSYSSGMPQKDRYSSVDNINQNGRRPLFASSHDIYNMFQSGNSVASQLQRPASYRHSFHAMPSTLQMMQTIEHQNQASESVPRPRSSSASVSAATQTKSSSSSWNPFGSLLRKKNKTEQTTASEQNLKSEHKSTQSKQTKSDLKMQQTKQKEGKSSKTKKGKSGEVEISVHLKGTGQPSEKANGVPARHLQPSGGKYHHEGKVTGLPFKTITLMEDNGTKLSTLV